MTTRLLHSACLLLVGLLVLAGCGGDFPPWSAPERDTSVAVRETPSGGVEALLVPCSPVRVTRVEVIAPRGEGDREGDPRLWQVDFTPPATDLRDVTLGVVPPGGTETVPWPATGLGQDPDASYIVNVVLDDGTAWEQGFSQERHLADGSVRFHDRNMSPDTFAEESRCP